MQEVKQMAINQKGFSAVLIVGLLAAGIIAGTYLVQSGGNFLPKAAEQEGLNPSAGKTEDCNKYDQDVNKEACIKKNNERCAADTVTYCDNRDGKRAIRKSGGYWDPTHPHQDPDSGCVFDYREVIEKKSECGKSESKNGDVVYTTKDEAKRLDTNRAEQARRSSGGQSSSGGDQTTACTPAATNAYYDAKVANNLARFYAILNGAGGLCVPADLGVPPQDNATVKDASGKDVTGRLMMCSDKDNPDQLYWMIVDPNKNTLVPVPESVKKAPEKDTIEAGFKNLTDARRKAGLDSGVECKEE